MVVERRFSGGAQEQARVGQRFACAQIRFTPHHSAVRTDSKLPMRIQRYIRTARNCPRTTSMPKLIPLQNGLPSDVQSADFPSHAAHQAVRPKFSKSASKERTDSKQRVHSSLFRCGTNQKPGWRAQTLRIFTLVPTYTPASGENSRLPVPLVLHGILKRTRTLRRQRLRAHGCPSAH